MRLQTEIASFGTGVLRELRGKEPQGDKKDIADPLKMDKEGDRLRRFDPMDPFMVGSIKFLSMVLFAPEDAN